MQNFRNQETNTESNPTDMFSIKAGNGIAIPKPVINKSFLQKTKDDLIEMIVQNELIPNVILMSKANLDKFRSLKNNLLTFSEE